MMQYKVTSEDYAQDRQADLERVRKMLENPDSTDQTGTWFILQSIIGLRLD